MKKIAKIKPTRHILGTLTFISSLKTSLITSLSQYWMNISCPNKNITFHFVKWNILQIFFSETWNETICNWILRETDYKCFQLKMWPKINISATLLKYKLILQYDILISISLFQFDFSFSTLCDLIQPSDLKNK